ncbi:MAG TPA: hypothetical protein VHA06_05485 [Candidatus Angelobacter sp.]|nr:hypothetical protein [Candidatus Angelobacter sp.]
MSEIDPQFERGSDDKLTRAMRNLAATSQKGASAETGLGLAAAFRRHHTRRRRIRRISITGLVACFVAIAGLIFLQTPRMPRSAQKAAQNANQNANQAQIEPANTPAQAPEAIQTASIPAEKPRVVRKLSRPRVTSSRVAYSREFVALPGYDPEVPAEDLHIVRVQLPTSTLWQMGAPINPAGPERRVLADFVIGQDGTPYGVRLVHTTVF